MKTWFHGNSLPHTLKYFRKNFVKATLKRLIEEITLQLILSKSDFTQNYSFEKDFISRKIAIQFCSLISHSVEKREIHCHANYFSSNQLRVKFFSEKVDFTDFLRRNGGSKIS